MGTRIKTINYFVCDLHWPFVCTEVRRIKLGLEKRNSLLESKRIFEQKDRSNIIRVKGSENILVDEQVKRQFVSFD